MFLHAAQDPSDKTLTWPSEITYEVAEKWASEQPELYSTSEVAQGLW